MRHASTPAVVLVAALALTACGGSSKKTTSSSSSSSTPATDTTATTPPVSSKVDPRRVVLAKVVQLEQAAASGGSNEYCSLLTTRAQTQLESSLHATSCTGAFAQLERLAGPGALKRVALQAQSMNVSNVAVHGKSAIVTLPTARRISLIQSGGQWVINSIPLR